MGNLSPRLDLATFFIEVARVGATLPEMVSTGGQAASGTGGVASATRWVGDTLSAFRMSVVRGEGISRLYPGVCSVSGSERGRLCRATGGGEGLSSL